jgi:hypothetical protein
MSPDNRRRGEEGKNSEATDPCQEPFVVGAVFQHLLRVRNALYRSMALWLRSRLPPPRPSTLLQPLTLCCSSPGLDHIIPLLQEHGITTPNKLAQLSLRDMYEVGESLFQFLSLLSLPTSLSWSERRRR